MKKVAISLTIIILIFLTIYITFLAPYRLTGLMNVKAIKNNEVLTEYFKDYNIVRIKYLGSNTYEVFTERGQFIVIPDYSDDMEYKYTIFKNDKELIEVRNPM